MDTWFLEPVDMSTGDLRRALREMKNSRRGDLVSLRGMELDGEDCLVNVSIIDAMQYSAASIWTYINLSDAIAEIEEELRRRTQTGLTGLGSLRLSFKKRIKA